MEVFDVLSDVFNFIGKIFSTIYEGIYGIISVISSFFNLLFNIIRILPNPLYPCMLSFLSLYLIIFIYKLFRKG